MYDILIKNGRYPDYTAMEFIQGDIAVKDGKIVEIGTLDGPAELVIDASGRVVSPGFIDIHMHEENLKIENNKFVISKMMLEQGVTTAVGGNCGNLRQPVAEFKKFIESEGGSPVNYLILAGYYALYF